MTLAEDLGKKVMVQAVGNFTTPTLVDMNLYRIVVDPCSRITLATTPALTPDDSPQLLSANRWTNPNHLVLSRAVQTKTALLAGDEHPPMLVAEVERYFLAAAVVTMHRANTPPMSVALAAHPSPEPTKVATPTNTAIRLGRRLVSMADHHRALHTPLRTIT